MTTQIKLRRDSGANWDANSTVVLAAGEIGVNLSNGQFKLGDGTSTWAALTYFQPGSGSTSTNQLLNSPYDVTLDVNGNTTFPSQTYIRQNNSYTRTVNGANISGVPTVIWTGTNDNITSVKMTIQIEGYEAGDTTGWHTQTCEAIIAERYWNNAGTLDPQMTVYGVVHTSVDPLATFTVQRNPTTHFIEVVATPTGTAFGTLYPKVHSVELGTRD